MVKKRALQVVWVRDAELQLKEILHYLREASPQGMRIVRDAIFARIKQLPDYPFMYEQDALYLHNDGSVRAFTVYHYRISYQISDHYIFILRVRHTSREPLEY